MNKPTWKDFAWAVIILLVVLLIIVMTIINQPTTPPISNSNVNIDSLLENTDSIKVIIQIKDSIKDEEIEQVLALDNDSTLELFKQLVRE